MPKIDLQKRRLSDRPAAALESAPDFYSRQISQARRFHLRLCGSFDKSITVICGGVEHCAADYEIRRGGFPYYGLEFVAGGTGKLQIKDQAVRLVPGTLFSYGPRVRHHILTDRDKPLVKYFVDFTGDRASKLLQMNGIVPGTAVQSSAPAEVMPIFDELIQNGSKNTSSSAAICAALLEALLHKLGETRMPPGSVETAAFDTYQRCLRLLDQTALTIKSLDELAELCMVDEAYLCRLFKRFGHESPYQRMLRLKMNHAAARLQSPGTLVKQVASELGFTDQYHFSRAFKSVFGVSPTKLIRQ